MCATSSADPLVEVSTKMALGWSRGDGCWNIEVMSDGSGVVVGLQTMIGISAEWRDFNASFAADVGPVGFVREGRISTTSRGTPKC